MGTCEAEKIMPSSACSKSTLCFGRYPQKRYGRVKINRFNAASVC